MNKKHMSSIFSALFLLSLVALPTLAEEVVAEVAKAEVVIPEAMEAVETSGLVSEEVAAPAEKRPVEHIVISVPAANNLISNRMMIAALKAGTVSSTSANITGFLRGSKLLSVRVEGDNKAVTAATIELAIKKLDGVGSTTKLYFSGTAKQEARIARIAEAAGVVFVGTQADE